MGLFSDSWAAVVSQVARLRAMLRRGSSPARGASPQGRSASAQRGRDSSLGGPVGLAASKAAKRRKVTAKGTKNSLQASPPPLVPAGAPTGAAADKERDARASADVLPALLHNPIAANVGGRHLSVESKHVRALVAKLPDTLKELKRMCMAPPPSSTASPSPSDATADRVREAAARLPPAAAPQPAATSSPVTVLCGPKRRSVAAEVPGAGAAAPSACATESDSAAIMEKVCLIEALLFPVATLQTPRPFALVVGPSSQTKSPKSHKKECGSSNPALEYYPPSLRAVSVKARKLAWKTLLQKAAASFSVLIGCLRSDVVLDDAMLCARLLGLVYNVLRSIPASKTKSSAENAKKASRICEKLGFPKTLSVVLRQYHTELQKLDRGAAGGYGKTTSSRQADGSTVQTPALHRFYCSRVFEAAVLLYAELGKYDVKVSTMFRLSRDLRRTVDLGQFLAYMNVLRTLENYKKLSDFNCAAVSVVVKKMHSEDSVSRAAALQRNRQSALAAIETVSQATNYYVGALSNVLLSLFLGTRTALAAQEVGVTGATLCLGIIGDVSVFVYQALPKVRRVLALSCGTGTRAATAGDKIEVLEPAWVQLYAHRLELLLFWAIALLQRLCQNDKKADYTQELHEKKHVMASLFLVLQSTRRESGRWPVTLIDQEGDEDDGALPSTPRSRNASVTTAANTPTSCGRAEDDAAAPDSGNSGEMSLAVLTAMKVIVQLDRAKALAELQSACGGLAGVVKEVLQRHCSSPTQWQRYYALLFAMYGVRLLPCRPGESPYQTELRLPPQLLTSSHPAAVADNSFGNSAREPESSSSKRVSPTSTGALPAVDAPAAVLLASDRAESRVPCPPTLPRDVRSPRGQSSYVEDSVDTRGRTGMPPFPAGSPLPATAAVGEAKACEPVEDTCVGSEYTSPQNFADDAPPNASLDATSLTPPSRNVSVPAVPLPPKLLLVDIHPEWYSPELRMFTQEDGEPVLREETTLPYYDLTSDEGLSRRFNFPWTFTEQPAPPTHQLKQHRNEKGQPQPLCGPTTAQMIAIVKHHIRRLKNLREDADDTAADAELWHKYNVVYERRDARTLTVCGESSNPTAPTDEHDTAKKCATKSPHKQSLHFNSNFESGNLKRAVRVADDEYDLVVSWDSSTNSFTQWFYFAVSNYEPGKTYRFNILNMEKKSSTFNEGQRPLMMWLPAASAENEMHKEECSGAGGSMADWRRVGQDIFYFENTYGRPVRESLRGQAPSLENQGDQNVAAGATPQPPQRQSSSTRRSRPSPTPPTANTAVKKAFVRRGFKESPTQRQSLQSRTPPVKQGLTPAPVIPELTKNFFTLTFSVTMPPKPGLVYLTNCFPYSYTHLRSHLRSLEDGSADSEAGQPQQSGESLSRSAQWCTMQALCCTLGGLPVPLVTATAMCDENGHPYSAEAVRCRPVCILTARIHPGETNGSWVMHGILEALLRRDDKQTAGGVAAAYRPEATKIIKGLLRSCVFKIVPMLNPDGVVLGNHRCSIAGVDLNRDYLHPDADVNPTNYALLRLAQHMTEVERRAVVMFADFHGHSKAKNFLIYGCTDAQSELLTKKLRRSGATAADNDPLLTPPPAVNDGGQLTDGAVEGSPLAEATTVAWEKMLPLLLRRAAPSFSLAQSSFAMQKVMRSSGRIVMYRRYGARMSYGIEGTMVGGRSADFTCPWRLESSRNEDGPGQSSICADTADETHYTQDSYSALGHSFLTAVGALFLCGVPASGTSSASPKTPAGLTLDGAILSQLAEAGVGKAPPLSPTLLPAPCSAVTTEIAAELEGVAVDDLRTLAGKAAAAGPYALAARRARRQSPSPPRSVQRSFSSSSPPRQCEAAPPVDDVRQSASRREVWRAGMQYLLSSASHLDRADDGIDEDSDDDNDSDTASRASPSTQRRGTAAGKGGRKVAAKAKGGAGAKKRVMARKTSSADVDVTVLTEDRKASIITPSDDAGSIAEDEQMETSTADREVDLSEVMTAAGADTLDPDMLSDITLSDADVGDLDDVDSDGSAYDDNASRAAGDSLHTPRDAREEADTRSEHSESESEDFGEPIRVPSIAFV